MFSVNVWDETLLSTHKQLYVKTAKRKINNLLHFNTGAYLTFYRVADSSSSTRKETEATVTSGAKEKQDITLLRVIHKMCSLHLSSGDKQTR